MNTITFFNNKSGAGNTLLAYHLAWMFAELGKNVIAVDLDPQANLTSAFLTEDRVEQLLGEDGEPQTVAAAIRPLQDRFGNLATGPIEEINSRIGLIPGDLRLSLFEDRLAESWEKCLDDNRSHREDAFRVITAFYRIMYRAAQQRAAEVVLVDVGPNLGALNRAALVACDFVVVPLAADLISLHSLRSLGPTLHSWRTGWSKRKEAASDLLRTLEMPAGTMKPIGYVLMQPAFRERYPGNAFRRWTERIPEVYHQQLLEEPVEKQIPTPDPSCLATLKNYRSLVPLAHDARKPMFMLNSSDGALGGQVNAVKSCYEDFQKLARQIAKECKIKLPTETNTPSGVFV